MSTPKKSHWGLWPFLVIVTLAGIILFLSGVTADELIAYQTEVRFRFLRTALSYLTLFSAGLLVLFSRVSYPRIQNLRVYLLGHLFCFTSLGSWLINTDLPQSWNTFFSLASRREFRGVLFSFILLNSSLIIFLPPFVKYRYTQLITLWIFGAELVIFFIFPHFIPKIKTTSFWNNFSPPHPLLFYLTSILLLSLLSLWRLRDEHGLGGIIAGILILFGSLVIIRERFENIYEISERIIFSAIPTILSVGLIYNWLSRLNHRIAYDPLLKIYTRDYCESIIDERAGLSLSPPFSLLMIDIDHFKSLNDKYGHQVGDVVLHEVAQVVAQRAMPKGITCRYGGEEIVVFLPNVSLKEARQVAQEIRKAVSQLKLKIAQKRLSTTVSIGVAGYEKNSLPVKVLIARADKALYRAKRAGRNRVAIVRVNY